MASAVTQELWCFGECRVNKIPNGCETIYTHCGWPGIACRASGTQGVGKLSETWYNLLAAEERALQAWPDSPIKALFQDHHPDAQRQTIQAQGPEGSEE